LHFFKARVLKLSPSSTS